MNQSMMKCAFVATILLSAAGVLAQQSGQPPSVGTNSGSATPAIIRSIQNELGRLGYYAGPMDGRASAETADAIRRYEKNKGLPPDGQASARLWSFMQASLQQGNQQRPQGTTVPGGTHINPNGTMCCR